MSDKDSQKNAKEPQKTSSVRRPSLESTASASTPTTGKFTTGRTSSDNLVTSYGQNLFDCVAAIVWCPKHKKLGMCRIPNRGLWFPFSPVGTGQAWYDCVCTKLKEVLKASGGNKNYLSFKPPVLKHVLRLQIPIYYDFIVRVLFYVEINEEKGCCVNSEAINWFSVEEVRKVKDLWGPEPVVFAEAIAGKGIDRVDSFCEFRVKDVLQYLPKDPPKTYQEEMVKAGGFEEKDILKLFGEYLQHTFPSQYMTGHSFGDYMTKLGITQGQSGLTLDMKSLFKAFSTNGSFVIFQELLLGLSAMDRNTPHGGHTGELRAMYVFRYYNQSGDNKCMDFEDMQSLVKDVYKLKGTAVDDKEVDKEVKAMFAAIGIDVKKQFDLKVFTKNVGEMKIRGTATLFRTNASPIQQIRMKRVYESIQLSQIQVTTAAEAKRQRTRGTCMRCKQKKYTLATHNVRLSKDGRITDPQENKGQVDLQKMSKNLRRQSDRCFLGSTTANVILDTLRAFSSTIPGLNDGQSSSKDTTWSSKTTRLQMFDKILKLCSDCEHMFRKEPRVVRVCSPVFVFGDIHGNFHDLCIYERALWKMGPTCVAPSFLFLGDYVDRGEYGVECILYLLALKSLCPDKYWLLRGNHELRPVQQSFTFRGECLEKFGSKQGLVVWEAFNKVFDVLPIGAVIDESIFCAHGGIPTNTLKIEELLTNIPMPMEDPENQCQNAWQMLWNDPVSGQEFRDYQELLKSQAGATAPVREGFLPNTKRGTAYYFSDDALNRFLTANQLSHVIRAHEVIPAGFAYHMGGKCITIFSSSKYCNGLNEAAVILVNDEKIRVIKVDTN